MYRIRKDGDRYFYEEKIKTMVEEFGNEEKAKVNVTTDNEWSPRCRFELIPRETHDFHEMLLFHQTNPESPFTHDRLCTMAKPWGRITLSGNNLTKSTYLGDNKIRKETKELGGEENVVNELEQQFGIRKESCLYPEGSMYCGSDQSKKTSI